MSRALTANFRKHVIALPPGSALEWRDIDAWAEANCPSARQGYDPDDFWAGTPWDERCGRPSRAWASLRVTDVLTFSFTFALAL
jgi:hypothetical protein